MSNPHMEHTASAVNATRAAEQDLLKDRLTEILTAAEWGQCAVERLKIKIGDLRDELAEIVEDPAADCNALDAAFDTITWLHGAIDNADGEFTTLVYHLQDAVEDVTNANTDQ
jgi:hypothetical protein